MLRSIILRRDVKLPRLIPVCFSSSYSDSQWSSSSRSRGAKPSRWGPPRAQQRGRDHWRDNGRRPPLTRTNDGKDVPQLAGEGVYGIHSVLQALESGHRDAHALYVREERVPMDGQRPKKKSAADVRALERIRELAEAKDVEIHTTSKWMLNHITGDKPHQGVVLDAAPIQLKEFVPAEPSEFTESERSPVILVLDEIHDPQNFGAILRSAHFLGCSAVVVSDRNNAPLSPAVSRASVGALEVMVANDKLMKARNLHEVLAISGDLGWRIVGASSGPNSITSTNLPVGAQPTILVMGNEHRGLRKGIRQCCQDIVIIPGQATDADTRVDSLNVSVASAILLYELLHH
ncbi:RNA methyltransferase, TrmH family, group 3, variant 1 [Phytophthora palmivora]|uniref:rRNA methyltransferase 1, mitochondrial n=1 Tax=Phytophthora palmivora TaxID=4796 RepID=A0A2P4Y930_9STRA|nr:RNA methyltransferase, TrmH family, group 3, variant 1 [Phytophthora palmivora]